MFKLFAFSTNSFKMTRVFFQKAFTTPDFEDKSSFYMYLRYIPTERRLCLIKVLQWKLADYGDHIWNENGKPGHPNRLPDIPFEVNLWGRQWWLKLSFVILVTYFVVRRHFVPRHFVPGHILSRDNMSPGHYVALCPHYFAVQRGDILSQETYCPGSVRRNIVPGDLLSRETYCPGWQQMVTFGNKW